MVSVMTFGIAEKYDRVNLMIGDIFTLRGAIQSINAVPRPIPTKKQNVDGGG